MKRTWNLISAGSMWLLLTGLLLSLLSGGGATSVNAAARICLAAAVALFIAATLLRPRALRAEAAGGIAGMDAATRAPQCDFRDVAANDEARASLLQLADYLREPQKYARYGARMPRGVLLYGPPGTGKTLLARALAGEAGVPFFALSGSDFVQMYVGVGASRVRELFKRARKAGRCVIFIDEIDAMAKKRDDMSSDERDQTLNALLSEMSGFRPTDGVIVLAATNRLEALDPALLRPGRFDRQIEVGLPGREERLSILRLHGRNKPLSSAVDLEALARDTSCFSGASLESLLNEAAIAAAERGAEAIEPEDIRGAFYKTVAGADRKSTASHAERRVIAVHEAGHALISLILTPENTLKRVSILPAGGGAAGYNLSIPPERTMLAKRDIENQIQVLLAGRAAEMLVGGEEALTAGASNDLTRAADLAAALIMDLGMGGEPAVSLRALGRACGGGDDAKALCRQKLDELFQRVANLLLERSDDLLRLTEALVARESMTGEEIKALLRDA
ncbi:MAG TPA: AAA family ATPase [Candidatus Pullichristensenella avicola]|nr:AAA family ATPase [Candidatus Pullichristensenella avicola]